MHATTDFARGPGGGGDRVTCTATSSRGELLNARLALGDDLRTPGDWTVAVTGRWNADARRGPVRLTRVPVEHEPWPLRQATVVGLRTNLLRARGLPAPSGPPHARWSPGVDVRIGAPRPSLP
ncbi:DUF2071 domain-containing protein [Cellulomonas algicola]|uniref:Uncharacterized protein n=1 Tax=Cellulomonas algicola TaxID=2071633 RepID=A0A401V3C6_9CELL|nr:DUF2071 domain-containing protein [Cellulomonas algicola]GCD21381.1 hypothetical protein CTKZ_29430 [Cellulomonas algicola]